MFVQVSATPLIWLQTPHIAQKSGPIMGGAMLMGDFREENG